jgi:indolepyruvate ferredoxin oxidoreductase
MAYKDEYEVARLFADPRFAARLRDAFEGDVALRFHLAPPLFARRDPDTGLPVKRRFGPWMMTAMRLLAHGKVLRGTPFDPFGRTAERRTERQLVADYEAVVDELIGGLDADNHALAVEIASVPEKIRGFGHVKARHLAEAKRCEADLLAVWRRRSVPVNAAA